MQAHRFFKAFANQVKRAGLMALALLALAPAVSAQTPPPALVGHTIWSGTVTQTPTPPGFTSGNFNVFATIDMDAAGNVIMNSTMRSVSQPQYYIYSTANGTLSGTTLNYTGSVHQQNLPFGDVSCNVGGPANLTVTTWTQAGSGSGSGGCSGTYVTSTLTNITGSQLGPNATSDAKDPKGPCNGCDKSMPVKGYMVAARGPQTEGSQGHTTQVGEPIDVTSGNVTETIKDYETAGPNQLSLIRYYNSEPGIFTYAQEMGQGWRTNYDRYLNVSPSFLSGYVGVVGATGNLIAERPDGQQMIFNQVSGTYLADPQDDATLTNIGAVWTLTLHDDTVETYTVTAGKGVLTSIRKRGGYTQTLAYNGSGQLSTVTDSYGRVLTFTYTGTLLTQVTTPDSLIVTYGYNSSTGGANDRLASVSYNTSPASSVTYGYTNASFPFALTSLTDENGNVFASWTYDIYGRGLTSQYAGGSELTTVVYNASAGTTTATNALGQVATYTYSAFGTRMQVTNVAHTLSTTTINNGFTYDANHFPATYQTWNGFFTAYTSNAHGDPLTIVEATGQPIARTTTFTYDPVWVHQPATIVTPGLTTSFTYDTDGNMLTRTETDTTTTSVPYSTAGQTRTWTYTWSNFLPATAKTPNGNVTTFTWDASGALTGVSNALTQATSVTSHTGGGRPLTVVDPNGVTTTLTYNARNWPLTQTVATAAGNRTTTNTYDPAGNLTQVTLPDGSYYTATFDTAHRLTKLADSFGNSINYTLNAFGEPTATNVENPALTVTTKNTATYDKWGEILTYFNGQNWQQTFAYDYNGDLTSHGMPGQGNTFGIDALSRTTAAGSYPYANITYTYDSHDRPLSVQTRAAQTTGYIYDGFGDMIQETSPDRGTIVYHYDADANATSKLDGAGVTTNYTYDALDRLATVAYPADTAENVTYTYDQTGTGFTFGIGRLTSVADMAGTLTRQYDERGNLTQEKRVSGATTLTTGYGYDAASRVSSITYPSGLAVNYVRDAMGRITSVTGQPSGAGSATTLASGVTYEPFGPYLALTYGNGIVETLTRDLDYKILTLKDIGTATVQSISMGYGTADLAGPYIDNLAGTNSLNTGYDQLYHITGSHISAGNHGYASDGNGNRTIQGLTPSSTNITYGYAANSNKLTGITQSSATNTVTSDGNGSVTGFSTPYGAAGVSTLSYNKAGRLTSVSSTSATLGTYLYDGLGNRFSKTVGGTTTQFIHAGSAIIEETTGGTPKDYIYLNGRAIAMLTGTTFTYLHGNNVGSPQVATSAAQAVAWKLSTLAFGETIATSGTATVNLRFPGQYYDAETGFNHNGFRDYVPSLGRYLEFDPMGLGVGLNPYIYVGDRPLDLIDPWGLLDSLLPPSNFMGVPIPPGGFTANTPAAIQQGWQPGNDAPYNIMDDIKFYTEFAFQGFTGEGAGILAGAAPKVCKITVGRWMSQYELDYMLTHGRMLESKLGGVTSVSIPPDPIAWKSLDPNSIFTIFDVPSTSVGGIGNGWGKIWGPNSIFGQGGRITEMPTATKITPTK